MSSSLPSDALGVFPPGVGHAFHRDGFPSSLVDEIKKQSDGHQEETISGGYKQIDVLKLLSPELKTQILQELCRLQPNIPRHFVFHQLKILIGEPGVLEQVTHTDSLERFLVAIVHLNAAPGLRSTEMADRYNELFDEKHPWSLPWAKDAANFISHMIEVGSVMFFYSDQCHRAPENKTNAVRLVLFCALGPPFSKPSQRFNDGISFFEFEFARMFGGAESEACIASLRRYYESHNPLAHYCHTPKQAAAWRAQLDRDFYDWTINQMPVLVERARTQPRGYRRQLVFLLFLFLLLFQFSCFCYFPG